MSASVSHPSVWAAFARWRGIRAFGTWLAVAFLGDFALAGSEPTREYQIKAAALCNVIAFTDWPDSAFESPDAPLVVGVMGTGRITALLYEFLNNETYRGRHIVLRSVALAAEARSCHVVYVAQSERRAWTALNRELLRLPILTISDSEDFARSGGVVELAIQQNKLRLIVNLGIAREAGLTISSKVLRLSNVIADRDP